MNEINYNGIKLTPNVFKTIMIEFLDGKQFSRQQAIDIVKDAFLKRGGVIADTNMVQCFKKATQSLKDKGIENIGYGVWRLAYNTNDVIVIDDTTDAIDNIDFGKYADKVIGEGDKYIYVYYYDTYKKYAEKIGCNVWQCKVGKTDKDVIDRVLGQSGTSYPEKPHIALVIQCDNSTILENALHSILKFRKKWIKEAPGNEWFMTNEKEIELIYNSIK